MMVKVIGGTELDVGRWYQEASMNNGIRAEAMTERNLISGFKPIICLLRH